MKIKYLTLFLMCTLGILKGVSAQDAAQSPLKETNAQRKARQKFNEHPNALTDDQRAQIKLAQDFAEYQRKKIAYSAGLTPKQKREQIYATKQHFMVEVKNILTPTQMANVTVKPMKPEVAAVAAAGIASTYEQRAKVTARVLDIVGDSVKIDFYDNGSIDGDSISVYLNDKLIIQHLMLLGTAASYTIAIDRTLPRNEIVMFAENLGTEPPNTALIVLTDGTRQYEMDVSSDLQQSGTIYLRPVARKAPVSSTAPVKIIKTN